MAERRLRPIYEALDSRNPRQAIKLCDAALKKGSFALIAALKAVALERAGRADEALQLAREVGSSLRPPVDDHLLSTLLIPFRAVGKMEETVPFYEAAHAAEPDVAELSDALLGIYLKVGAYAKAQQLAMRLYKAQSETALLCGAVTCILLQVDGMGPPRQPNRYYADVPPAAGAATHLQLAGAMLA